MARGFRDGFRRVGATILRAERVPLERTRDKKGVSFVARLQWTGGLLVSMDTGGYGTSLPELGLLEPERYRDTPAFGITE